MHEPTKRLKSPLFRHRRLTNLVKIFGYLVVAAALLFLAQALIRNAAAVWDLAADLTLLLDLFGIGVIYFLLLSSLPIYWLLLTSAYHWLSWRDAYCIYGRAQIAKYLPGNVFQLAARQWLGGQEGISQADLALASFLEIVLTAFAAGLVALAMLPPGFLVAFNEVRIHPVLFNGTIALCLMILGTYLLVTRKVRRAISTHVSNAISKLNPVVIGAAFAGYIVFFVGFSALVALLNQFLGGGMLWGETGIIVMGAAALSWFAGFVTPGAPGGIGVRETVFILIAGSVVGEERSLAVIILFRIVTTIADLAMFGLAALKKNF